MLLAGEDRSNDEVPFLLDGMLGDFGVDGVTIRASLISDILTSGVRAGREEDRLYITSSSMYCYTVLPEVRILKPFAVF